MEHMEQECLSGWFLSLVSGFNIREGQPRRGQGQGRRGGECFMEEGGEDPRDSGLATHSAVMLRLDS